MFKKKENGFSLVELSVAAAVAVGLAVVAVAVVSGTATSVSSKGTSAASVESCTISESLAKAGGDDASIVDCVSIQGGSGSQSAPSEPEAPAATVVAPNAPLDLTTSNFNGTGLTLSWSAPSTEGENNTVKPIDGYKVYVNNNLIITLGADKFSTNLIGLTHSTAYTFKVEAYNSAGQTESTISPTTPGFFLATNGVTIKCPGVSTGATFTLNGVTYTKFTSMTISTPLSSMETACTTGMTNMKEIFRSRTFTGNISHWDTSSVTTMVTMFQKTEGFNGDISKWDTSKVADMSSMFRDNGSFNQNLSGWCVPLVGGYPSSFASGASLSQSNFPIWGTCPVQP
jgi:surface protein